MQEVKYRIVHVNENVVFHFCLKKKRTKIEMNDVIFYAVQRMMVKGFFPGKPNSWKSLHAFEHANNKTWKVTIFSYSA